LSPWLPRLWNLEMGGFLNQPCWNASLGQPYWGCWLNPSPQKLCVRLK
jgi:hypothetical protein